MVRFEFATEPEGNRESLLTKDDDDAMPFLTEAAIKIMNEEVIIAVHKVLHADIEFVVENIQEMGVQVDGELGEFINRIQTQRATNKT